MIALMTGLPRVDLLAAGTAGDGSASRTETPTTPRSANPANSEEPGATAVEQEKREVVFLLHGIGKGPYDMALVERALRRRGYEVVNWQYPSRKKSLENIADLLHERMQKYDGRRVSFVTHSMGGIVVRTYLNKYKPANPGRLVMIAPPNQGAFLADLFGNWLAYRLILGPAGQQLRQGEQGACASAGSPCCEFGIIAGGTGRARGMNPLVPGDNDGTISVECTKLDGAKDFLVLPYAHVHIQFMPRTVRNVISFLESGKFDTTIMPGETKRPSRWSRRRGAAPAGAASI